MEIREQLLTVTEVRNLEHVGFSSEEIASLFRLKELYQRGAYQEATPEFKRLAFVRWLYLPTWQWKVECTRAKPCPHRSGQNWMPSTDARPYGLPCLSCASSLSALTDQANELTCWLSAIRLALIWTARSSWTSASSN